MTRTVSDLPAEQPEQFEGEHEVNACLNAYSEGVKAGKHQQPEQCFSVRENAEGASMVDWAIRRYPEALSIRSVDEVRREAIREALMWKLTRVGHPADNPAIIALVDKEVNEIIDTPAAQTGGE